MEKFTVKNLDLWYNDFKALKNINLGMQENSITAFIGPSGCGKSTLLKSLNRMNDLVEGCRITGEVLLDGEDIYGNMDVNLLRKRVGMVFQKPNPFPMSIYDNIAFVPTAYAQRQSLMKLWRNRCVTPLYGTKPRTCLKRAPLQCRAGSSSAFALRARWL